MTLLSFAVTGLLASLAILVVCAVLAAVVCGLSARKRRAAAKADRTVARARNRWTNSLRRWW